jgi:hypothetical protein
MMLTLTNSAGNIKNLVNIVEFINNIESYRLAEK